ncbi:hypothetical protein [Paenibacillus oryzisoli]|uniref:hypothetical protein n=1 Tax=Paenibacillus oryzisoli TaxID=1850517 RepID=UPI0012F96106|nr:hypothetical protein [Paenibacillus oryzisoli]
MSIELMKTFIIDGKYLEMKTIEKELTLVKDFIKKSLDDKELEFSRYEWKSLGIVAKYTRVYKYEWNKEELQELLYDLGILPHVSKIDEKLLTPDQKILLTPFVLNDRKTIRYFPNNQSKSVDVVLTTVVQDSKDCSLEFFLLWWKKLNGKYHILLAEWKKLKSIAAISQSFSVETKIHWELGVFCLQSKLEYDTLRIFKSDLHDLLIKCCKVEISELDRFLAKGLINKREIDNFRKIQDIFVRFTLIEKSRENKIFEYLSKRRSKILNFNL